VHGQVNGEGGMSADSANIKIDYRSGEQKVHGVIGQGKLIVKNPGASNLEDLSGVLCGKVRIFPRGVSNTLLIRLAEGDIILN
jgi:hypothetical protein